MARHHGHMGREEADLLVRCLILLNSQPRIAPRDRRLRYDSVSLSSEISELLKRHGWNYQLLSDNLPRD